MALLEADAWPSAKTVGFFIRSNTDWDMPDRDVTLLSTLAHSAVSFSAIDDVAVSDSRLVATAAAVVMGAGDVAFIAYVCVDERERRQGLARRALLRLLRQLDIVHAVTRAMLVATAVAEPLYRNLGFTDFPHVKVRRYKFTGSTSPPQSSKDAALLQSRDNLERGVAIVAAAAKGDIHDSRSTLLRTAVIDHGAVVAVAGYQDACCFIRRDEKEHRLGPLAAFTVDSGVRAVNEAATMVTSRADYQSLTAMAIVRTDCNLAHNVLVGAGFVAGDSIPFLHLNCAAPHNLSVASALANREYLALTGFEHL